MWINILAVSFLIFVLIYEPTRKPTPNGDHTYFVSLITLKNNANAPFYYHSTLELIGPNETISYGFYPYHSDKLIFNHKLFKYIYRFLRPVYPMPARIRSPDPLYEGSVEQKINPGKVVYRELYPVLSQEWLDLKYQLGKSLSKTDIPLFYSYAGSYLSDNCSSWLRKLLNKNLHIEISCQRYRFKLFGLHFAIPISPFEFPGLCSSTIPKTLSFGFGSTNKR